MLLLHCRGILWVSVFDSFCATWWLFSFQHSRGPYVGCCLPSNSISLFLSRGGTSVFVAYGHWADLSALGLLSSPGLVLHLLPGFSRLPPHLTLLRYHLILQVLFYSTHVLKHLWHFLVFLRAAFRVSNPAVLSAVLFPLFLRGWLLVCPTASFRPAPT